MTTYDHSLPAPSGARNLVATAEVAVPRAANQVIERAIQDHGRAGISDDTPLAAMHGWHRATRLLDGPDEVHVRSIARGGLGRDPVLPPAGPRTGGAA